MALTVFQEEVCRLIARNRVASGESYIAGGVALNVALDAPRLSRDIDIFHDSAEALQVSWEQDRILLEEQGFRIEIVREAQAYVEAVIRSKDDQVLLQWMRDSAYRFFPLVEDERLGLTLHPFDLATNKVLALVGRLEIRDWIDVQESAGKIQPLGLLAWAACGKDPGFSPLAILNEAARSSHYSMEELDRLDFAGPPPDLAALSLRWKEMLKTAHQMIGLLPAEHAGQCLLESDGKLFSGDLEKLKGMLGLGASQWHRGTLGGVLPEIIPS